VFDIASEIMNTLTHVPALRRDLASRMTEIASYARRKHLHPLEQASALLIAISTFNKQLDVVTSLVAALNDMVASVRKKASPQVGFATETEVRHIRC